MVVIWIVLRVIVGVRAIVDALCVIVDVLRVIVDLKEFRKI